MMGCANVWDGGGLSKAKPVDKVNIKFCFGKPQEDERNNITACWASGSPDWECMLGVILYGAWDNA